MKTYLSYQGNNPFFNPSQRGVWGFSDQQISDWEEIYGRHITIVSDPGVCDIWAYPDMYRKEQLSQLIIMSQQALRYGKKIIVMEYSDDDESIDLPNIIHFKSSILKSNRKSHEYVLPPFIDYPSEIELKPLSTNPVIGYVGYSD